MWKKAAQIAAENKSYEQKKELSVKPRKLDETTLWQSYQRKDTNGGGTQKMGGESL